MVITTEQKQLESKIIKKIAAVGSPSHAYHPDVIASLGQHLQQYIAMIRQLSDSVEQIARFWQEIAQLPEGQEGIYGKILVEFELLEYTENGSLTDQYLQQILQAGELGWRNQLYLSRQLQSLLFTNTVKAGEQTGQLQWEIYEQAYEALEKEISLFWQENYAEKCPGGLQWIPGSERQQGLVMVTTSQVLSEQHAPTKTALDRCTVLFRDMGMRVILVNTAEQGAEIGNILLFHRMQTHYKKILSEKDHISFHGIQIPFLQCSPNMPNAVETAELIRFVAEEKPAYIINIGGGSLVTDLLGNMVPVLTVATVFSSLAMTKAQFQTIGRPLAASDMSLLHSRGKSAEHVISGRFTFALKEQVEVLSRKLLAIPEDRFVLIIVGARLEREVTEDFLQMLLEIAEQGAYLVFLGEMDYESRLSRFPELKQCSVYLGSRSDVLAVMDQVDAYVNPPRSGGGSSVVEAMVKGVVPVTLAHGDVYVNTGDEFAVEDFAAMQAELLRLMQDREYYVVKSELARERASVLMDSSSAFRDVLEEFQAREQMREKYLVSIIIPCYNVEKYVERCLESVLSQTMGREHIQIILVDDASEDGTLEILMRYEAAYPDNIVLLPLEKNVGLGAARNMAFEYAIADYVGYVDADDWVSPHMFACLYQMANQEKTDFVVCGMDRPRRFFSEPCQTSSDLGEVQYYEWQTVQEKERDLFANRADIMCTDKLFRRSFLLKHHISFPEGVKYEDHYFGMLAWLAARRVVRIKRVFYHWYQNTQSICMSGKAVLDRITVQRELYLECGKRGYLEYFDSFLAYNMYEKMVVETVYYLRRQGKDIAALLKDLMSQMKDLGINIQQNPYYIQETGGQ